MDVDNQKWRPGSFLGRGGCGIVYECFADDKDTHVEYAVKFEKARQSTLKNELKMYKILNGVTTAKKNKTKRHCGISKIYGYGTCYLPNLSDQIKQGQNEISFRGDILKYNFLVMDKLKSSKTTILNRYDRVERLRAAIKILHVIEYVHMLNVLHLDIKPQNIMMDERENFYLVDFGIGVVNESTSRSSGRKLSCIGTLNYMSIDGHHNLKTKRSDMHSFMYTLFVYFGLSRMPWNARSMPQKNRLKEICELKRIMEKSNYCSIVRTLNLSFESKKLFMEFVRRLIALKADSVPDYFSLRKLLWRMIDTEKG